jgi:hypothetical protein
LHEVQRTAEPARHGLRPRAEDDPSRYRPTIEVGRNLVAELDGSVGDRAVREGQGQVLRLRIVRRLDLDQLPVANLSVAPSVLVDDVEAAVREDTGPVQLHLVGMDEREAFNGRNRNARDGRHPRKGTRPFRPARCQAPRSVRGKSVSKDAGFVSRTSVSAS